MRERASICLPGGMDGKRVHAPRAKRWNLPQSHTKAPAAQGPLRPLGTAAHARPPIPPLFPQPTRRHGRVRAAPCLGRGPGLPRPARGPPHASMMHCMITPEYCGWPQGGGGRGCKKLEFPTSCEERRGDAHTHDHSRVLWVAASGGWVGRRFCFLATWCWGEGEWTGQPLRVLRPHDTRQHDRIRVYI